MRRLEVIDEEKRARTTEMRHCGIDQWQSDEIPFGVRALQTGVEVDGIWVSRPFSPGTSQVASSTTLMWNCIEQDKEKTHKYSDAASGSEPRRRYTSENSTIDQVLQDEPFAQDTTAPDCISSLDLKSPPGDMASEGEQRQGEVRSYLPTGLQPPKSSNTCFTPSQLSSEVAPSANEPGGEINSSRTPGLATSSTNTVPEPDNITVHANKVTRKPNENFEILPAGTFGPRPDIQDLPSTGSEDIRLPHFQPGPAKLRKKRTPGTR
jgi:hypothetical protein